MRMMRIFIAIALSVLAVTAVAQQLPQPPNTSINIGDHVSQTAATVLAGRGITLNDALSTPPSVDVSGREIAWRQVRAHVDNRGGKHVFYRQHLLDHGMDAEIYGSEVGVHSSPNGVIWSISGHQFASVAPSNRVMFNATDAADRARARLVRDIDSVPRRQHPSRSARGALRTLNCGLHGTVAPFVTSGLRTRATTKAMTTTL